LSAALHAAEFIEDYWRLHAVPNLEPQTHRNYRQQWAKHILPRLGEYELRAINAAIILRELVEPMRRAGAGAGDRRCCKSSPCCRRSSPTPSRPTG
jgi:Phage integrase, N-terminal SAM-like domain